MQHRAIRLLVQFVSPRISLIAICVALVIAACGQRNAEVYPLTMETAPVTTLTDLRAPEFAPSAISIEAHKIDNTLAYEHNYSVEIDKELLVARLEAVRSACANDKPGNCTLLEITNDASNGIANGSIKLRIIPTGVSAMAKLAAEGGRIENSRTSAEDLAQPLADTDRQLTLLNVHHKRLMEFMNRKDMRVTDLISVSKELATVQSELDEYEARRANLRRRVDTELLTINWHPPLIAYAASRTPIMDAFESFGTNFNQAIAEVIAFLAHLLPWLVILLPCLALARWTWRKTNFWIASRRKQTSAESKID